MTQTASKTFIIKYPQNQMEFNIDKLKKTFGKRVPYDLKERCNNCGLRFTSEINHTPEDWVRSQTKGICGECYEDIQANGIPEDD